MSGIKHKVPKIHGFKKNEILAAVKHKIRFDPMWTKAVLLKLGDLQTPKELEKSETIEDNNFGFDISNAAILTHYYRLVKSKKVELGPGEYKILGMMLAKYASQIAALSDVEKLTKTVKSFYSLKSKKE